MRGIAYDRFGDVDVLTLRDDLPEPPVGPDVVLVRVHAVGVNPVDLGVRAGHLAGAFPHHFPIIPGWDVSGVVEAAGPAVVDLAPGDEVFGYVRRDDVQWGTTAELVPAPQRCLARKPASLSFAEAGALPLAGLTAYQALTWHLNLAEGDRVLITRGSGGVGTMAIQIAVALGAHVVTTASARNEGYVRSLGAAEVYDHSAGPVSEQLAEPVDALLDLVGGATMHDAVKVVRLDPPRGIRLASVVDTAIKEHGGAYLFVHPDGAGLGELATMAAVGHLRVPIARAFGLEETAAAHRMVGEGHVRGKVVVTLR
jgi:NADPH:quinone reductase-like Zn-dependent oxidoreductase